MTDQVWWYVARASGLVAWAVLVLALVWGVLLSTRLFSPTARPPWMLAVHRWLGGTALVLVGVHLGALIADSFVRFTVVDLVVPFASDYRRGPVALGVLALYLLVAVQVSSLAMRRIPRSWWRWVHTSSYLLVVVVSLHAALVGTDALRGAYRFGTAVLVLAPVVAVAVRLASRGGPLRGRRVLVPTRLPSP